MHSLNIDGFGPSNPQFAMKHFFGHLLLIIGALAALALVIPTPRGQELYWARFLQASLSAGCLLAGLTCSRKSKHVAK